MLSVDYRQGPEHRFPAASEDVVAVYRELLESYEPQSIGIYGCSAGGVLTAESMAWIDKEKLPTPGALGILCAGAGGWGDGDSGFLNNALVGFGAPQPDTMRRPAVSDTIYFADADFSDPLVAPVRSDELLSRFPPTLVLTSTRDVAASSAVYTHTRLSGVGVETRLHVWEGQPHGFLSGEPDFPESRAAWETVVRFFDTFLGRDE